MIDRTIPSLLGPSGLRTDRIQAAGLVAVAVVLAAASVAMGTAARGLIGLVGLLLFAQIALASRDLSLSLIVAFLVLLGFVRRLLIPFAGWSPEDPLLLISPAAAVLLLISNPDDRPPPRTVLSSMAAFLLLWVVAQIVNPAEESMLLALQASLFYVVPLLWFFVGRTLSMEQHERVLRTVMWMSIPVLVLGAYHTTNRFLPFEYTWLGVSGQGAAVFLPGFRIRPFSTLVSPQEYGFFLSFLAVIAFARYLHRAGPRWVSGSLVPLAVIALFFQASRSIFLFCLLALAATLVAHRRSLEVVLGVLGLVAMLTMVSMAVDVQPASEDDEGEASAGPVAVLALHTLSGITSPDQSTAPVHLDLIREGLTDGVRHPFGRGLSEGSVARARLQEEAGGKESDVAQTMSSLGVPAGLTLMGIIVLGLLGSWRINRIEPTWVHLAWFGLGVAALNQWLSGALYATSTLLFLSMGGLARAIGDRTSHLSDPAAEAEAAAAAERDEETAEGGEPPAHAHA